MVEKDLIWVEKEFAKKYNAMTEDEQEKAFIEHLQKCKDEVKREYESTLACMKDDAAVFRGVMVEVRKEFKKFADEHLQVSYKLWENYDKELPKLKEKVNNFIVQLTPITNELKTINNEIGKIQTWQIEKLVEIISAVNKLDCEAKEMLTFLIHNYKCKQ